MTKPIKWLSLTLVISFVIALFSFHLPFVQRKLTARVIAQAKEIGLDLSHGNMVGLFPLYWKVDTVDLHFAEQELELEDVSLSLSVFALWEKKLRISSLKAMRATLTYSLLKEEKQPIKTPSTLPDLPFPIEISSLHVKEFHLINRIAEKSSSFSLKGKLFLNTDISGRIDLATYEIAQQTLLGKLSLDTLEKSESLACSLQLNLSNQKWLEPLCFSLPPIGGEISLDLKAPISTWEALISGEKSKARIPMKATVRGDLDTSILLPSSPVSDFWKLDASCILWADRSLEIGKALLENGSSLIRAQLSLDSHQNLKTLTANMRIRDLAEFNVGIDLSGMLEGDVELREDTLQARLFSKQIESDTHKWTQLLWTIEGTKEKDQWEIASKFSVSDPEHITAIANGWVNVDGKGFFDPIFLSRKENLISGTLHFDWTQPFLSSNFYLFFPFLSDFSSYFPLLSPFGQIGGTISMNWAPENLQYKADISGSSLHLKNVSIEQLTLDVDFNERAKQRWGGASLELQDAEWFSLHFDSLTFATPIATGFSPYSLYANGQWKEDFTVELTGIWEEIERGLEIELRSFKGATESDLFSLETPCSLYCAQDQLSLSECMISSRNGRLQGNFSLTNEGFSAAASAQHFPIDFLSLLNPNILIEGSSSFAGFVIANEEQLKGRLDLQIERADLLRFGQGEALHSKGSVHCNLENGAMQVHSFFLASNDQFFELAASLPVDFNPKSRKISLNRQGLLSAQLTLEGELSEIFDFVEIGSHSFTGLLSTHLFVSGSAMSPLVKGTVELQGGTYTNYATGTSLQKIFTTLSAEGDAIILNQLTAKDDHQGSLTAEGKLFLRPIKGYPFHIDTELNELRTIDLDKVVANLSGKLSLRGNAQEAFAKGDLQVELAEIFLPDTIADEIPEIEVTYRNPKPDISYRPSLGLYPVHLDLKLSADNRVYVRGKGLSSEWEGSVHVTGTNTDFITSGSLELLKGEYVLSGKVFSVNQGEIVFSPSGWLQTNIALSGHLDLPVMKVLVSLRGPLLSPQLSFSSIPPMPTSAILSHVLFNKEITELSTVQAVQLAHLIVSLSSGGSNDMLDAIRRGLGIDRLNIVSKAESDEVSVQIGKYLIVDRYFVDGIMVTLSQSASSSDIIVEVELKKGFIFQAESQEEEEGKFTLKWNYNY